MSLNHLCLAASNIGWAAPDDPMILSLMKKLGYTGLEAAPTRLVGENPYTKLDQAAKISGQLREEYGLCIPSLQSIWYGQQGSLFDPVDALRLADYTCRAVDFAAAVGCPSLVFGNPRQRVIPAGTDPDSAMPFFQKIADYARAHGAVIALEANPPVYGTNFCNTSEDAFTFARRVPGLAVNYDLGTLLTNGESLIPLFENLDLVSHIHLSEPGLAPLEPRPLHRELAHQLREFGYQGFVSIEMKTQPLEIAERVLQYAAEVFL